MVESACARYNRLLRREPWVSYNAFGYDFGCLDGRSLDIDRTDAELFVPEQAFKSIRPVMLDQVGVAFDLTNQIRFIAARIEVSVPDLPIIMSADGVVSLAYMNGDMNIRGQAFNREIDRFDRGSHFIVARRGQVRF